MARLRKITPIIQRAIGITAILACSFLSSCSNWTEADGAIVIKKIEDRFGIEVKQADLLNSGRTRSGDSWKIKAARNDETLDQIINHKSVIRDVIIEIGRLGNEFEWWDLNNKAVRYVKIEESGPNSFSAWIDDSGEVVYIEILFQEAF